MPVCSSNASPGILDDIKRKQFIPYECELRDSKAAQMMMQIILTSSILSLILSCIVSPSFAATNVAEDSFQQGVAAHARGDYAAAVNQWRPLAEHGHAEAQFVLGLMYAKGQGVPQNLNEAAAWYRKAAEQEHAAAQYSLGTAYYVGLGVAQDYKEAASRSRKAADQGIAEAQGNLGVMYAQGRGLPQDYIYAHMWFTLAGMNGDQDALRNRQMIESRMTKSQIEQAQRLVREWIAKHKNER